MHLYGSAVRRLPRRHVIPITQVGHRRAARRLLGPAAHRCRLGHGGVLFLRPDPRHSAHQPVLDAGQRRLRRAPGQAAVRLHRRRREPGRRRRRRDHRDRWSSEVGSNNLLLVSARSRWPSASAIVDAIVRRQPTPATRLRRGRARRRRTRGVPAAGASRGTCRVIALVDRLRRGRRRHRRAATEHGGRSRRAATATPSRRSSRR